MTHEPNWYGEDLSRKVRELTVMLINEEYEKNEALKLVNDIKELTFKLEVSLEFHGDALSIKETKE